MLHYDKCVPSLAFEITWSAEQMLFFRESEVNWGRRESEKTSVTVLL